MQQAAEMDIENLDLSTSSYFQEVFKMQISFAVILRRDMCHKLLEVKNYTQGYPKSHSCGVFTISFIYKKRYLKKYR